MKITDFFIKRPVLALSVNLLIFIAGIQALLMLNVRQYPRSESALVTVKTAYIGASADLVRGYISTPLERVIASADGIDYIESASRQGISEITAHLRLNYDVNAALTQIQSKVAQVRNDLPPEAEAPFINVESGDGRFASMYIGFSSDELEANQITEYLNRVVQPQLSAVAGVQRADILGARTFAMRVWLKPDRMAALGIAPTEVRRALAANNFLAAVGETKGSMLSIKLVANTDLRSVDEFKKLVVHQKGDTSVRLEDIADVVLGAESYDEDIRFNGDVATFIGVWVLPNANSLDVISRVRKALPDLQRNLPSGLRMVVPFDATAYIRNAIREVVSTLLETIAIVIVVIFLFIGSLRAVLVPIVAIPLSLIGALSLMLVAGFTINLLTLLAIVLAVGLVVDDAIVVLENVERHVRAGMAPIEAALTAGRELFVPIVAMTITLAAVYAPIGIQGGLTGALFREFAFTLAGAVLISGIVALTLSPMMAARMVRRHEQESRFQQGVAARLAWVQRVYQTGLERVFHYRFGVRIFAAGFVVLAFPLYLFSTRELAPREDQGIVFGIVQGAPDATIEQMRLFTSQINAVYQSVPEYSGSFQSTGPGSGFSGMVLKRQAERSRSIEQLLPELQAGVAAIPGVQTVLTSPPPLPGGSDFAVELVVAATDEPERVLGIAGQLVGAAYASGSFVYADTDLKFDLPQAEVVLDKDKVNAMGLPLSSIAEDLSVYLSGNYVNRFSLLGRSYKVIPQVTREARLTPAQLLDLHIRGALGRMMPLRTVAHIEERVQPRQLNRFQQMTSAKIQGVPRPGVSVDEALRVLEERAAQLLPPGYRLDYAGESRQLRSEGRSMTSTLLLALLVIFLVMAAQFESFRDPLTVLAGSVPLALTGALVWIFLGATTLNIYSQVGLVTLVGLVAKNGILIVEFANKLVHTGRTRREAAIAAAVGRLRPILMTTAATVVGHLPLVFASGAGAGARNSIGITLVSGMVIGTALTLFVVPVLYEWFGGSGERLGHGAGTGAG